MKKFYLFYSIGFLIWFFYFFYFSFIFPSFAFASSVFETEELLILQKSKKLSDLQENLGDLRESREILRACEFEREFKKIPKACFQASRIKSLSQKKKEIYYEVAQNLCKEVVQKSSSLENLKKWEKISLLSTQCKDLLKKRLEILIYKQKEIFVRPS